MRTLRLFIFFIIADIYLVATAQNRDIISEEKEHDTQCMKLPMAEDGIVRLSRIEVYPQQGTLHMVKSLELCDQNPLNPDSKLINKIK